MQIVLSPTPTHRIYIKSKDNDTKSFSVVANCEIKDITKSCIDKMKLILIEPIFYENVPIPRTTHYISILNIELNKMKNLSVCFPSYSCEEISIELKKHLFEVKE